MNPGGEEGGDSMQWNDMGRGVFKVGTDSGAVSQKPNPQGGLNAWLAVTGVKVWH